MPRTTTSAIGRIHEQLRQRILNGQLTGRMPPERQLAEEHGVSHMSIRTVLARLEHEGLIIRRQGSGTYVREAGGGSAPTKQLLGVLLADSIAEGLANPFYGLVANGAFAVAEDAGFGLVVTTDLGRLIPSADQHGSARHVEGIVCLSSPVADPQHLATARRLVPMVVVNPSADDAPGDAIGADDSSAVAMAFGHLREHGHRRIAFIGGPRHLRSAARRERAFLALAGDSFDRQLIETADYHHAGGRRAMAAILERASDATAVIAANESMALGAMHEALSRGIAVPGHLSVVGIDGLPLGGMVHPGLTTVDCAPEELGRRALHALLARLAGQEPDLSAPAVRLIRRASVA